MFLYYIVEGDLGTSQLQGGGEYCEDWLIGIMGRGYQGGEQGWVFICMWSDKE